MAARPLAVVHTCIHDAWAAYDEQAPEQCYGVRSVSPAVSVKYKQEGGHQFRRVRGVGRSFPSRSGPCIRSVDDTAQIRARHRINGYRCPKRFGERCVSCCLQFRHRMVPISSVILAAMDCPMPIARATSLDHPSCTAGSRRRGGPQSLAGIAIPRCEHILVTQECLGLTVVSGSALRLAFRRRERRYLFEERSSLAVHNIRKPSSKRSFKASGLISIPMPGLSGTVR